MKLVPNLLDDTYIKPKVVMNNCKNLSFCNYHKHTSLSHRYNKDSPLVPMDYFKEYAKYFGVLSDFASFP